MTDGTDDHRGQPIDDDHRDRPTDQRGARRTAPGSTVPRRRTDHDADTLADADDLLDEIDAALEENELEVLARYRQRGGQ